MTNTQETINTILLDVLKGAKEVGSEIYSAGKAGLIQAVDFAMQQAPLVVQEFLSWKMGQAVFNCIFYGIGAAILLSVIIWAKKKMKEAGSYDDIIVAYTLIFMFSIAALISLMFPIKENIDTIIKIKLAPRVYIIDYVTGKK